MNKFMKIFLIAFLFLMCATVTYSQKAAKKPAAAAKSSAATPADNYWSAQRNIESSIAQLEAFIKNTSSDDKRWQTAAAQLQMLKEIRIVPAKNQWSILMNSYQHIPSIMWRVATVETGADRTTVKIEINNTNEKDAQCFPAFDETPLILIDNKGESVPMLEVGELPGGIKTARNSGKKLWCIQGTQTIFVNVDFAPLARGATSGQINYGEYTTSLVAPAKFSLFQQNLK
jgi:hypothetical protein